VSTFAYDANSVLDLASVITASRLSPYLGQSGGDLQAAIDLYVWNIKASARLYGPLSIFEVALRNALSRELAEIFATPNWTDDAAFAELARTVAHAVPRNARAEGKPPYPATDLLGDVEKTRNRVTVALAKKARKTPGQDVRTMANTDDIVAALDFGFWTKLLNPDLESHLYFRGLHRAFPNAPLKGKYPARGPILNVLNGVRTLRNRVMHFEPLFRRNLADDIRDIIGACAFVDTTAAGWIAHHSEFEAGLRDRNRPRHYF
jgi:hypothetical protein